MRVLALPADKVGEVIVMDMRLAYRTGRAVGVDRKAARPTAGERAMIDRHAAPAGDIECYAVRVVQPAGRDACAVSRHCAARRQSEPDDDGIAGLDLQAPEQPCREWPCGPQHDWLACLAASGQSERPVIGSVGEHEMVAGPCLAERSAQGVRIRDGYFPERLR